MSKSKSIDIITAVPHFVSPEEHRNIVASTPSSFSDIRPVLRHKQENVSVILNPPIDEFTPEDKGVLYIIESALVFMSSTGHGFQVKYPAITLHAISRAEGSTPSIYCQLDETDTSSGAPPDEASEDVTEMRELTIVPQDAVSLEPIFEAMSVCASLHPDPNMSEDDNDGLGDGFVSDGQFETLNGDEQQELSEVGRAALAHLESIVYDPFDSGAEVNDDVDGAEDVLGEQDENKQ